MGEEELLIKIQAFFVGMTFHKKANSKARLLITAVIYDCSLHPKSTMILPVVKTIKDAKGEKKINMNIGVGSIMKSEVRYNRYNKRELIVTGMIKYVAVCVHDVAGKNNFLIIFEYCKKKDIIASSLSYICEKEDVGQEADDIIYYLSKIVQGELLTLNGDTVF